LITGGCCHDYARQKDILKSGIKARANAIVDQIHTGDSSTHPPLEDRIATLREMVVTPRR